MSEEPDICDICKKPILEHEPVYAGLRLRGIERHWSCHEKVGGGKSGDTFKEARKALDKVQESLTKLKDLATRLRR